MTWVVREVRRRVMEAPRASSWNWMAPRWEGVRAWPVTKAVMPARGRRGGEWEGEGEGEGEGEEDGVGVGGRRWERGRAMVGGGGRQACC